MTRRLRIQTQVRSPHKHWKLLVKSGAIDQIVLQPGSFLGEKELKALNHRYYPAPEVIPTTITRDTLFWYPDKTVAAVYLKNRIGQTAQDEALAGFREFVWTPPTTRGETRTAVERQQGNVAPGELLFGHLDRGTHEQTRVTREQFPAFLKLARILKEMNDIFSRTLPREFGQQNRPKPEAEKWKEYFDIGLKKPEYGGIPMEFRMLLTAFSTTTLLKSCPASLHKDGGNARLDQTSFTCLTTVRESDFVGGGVFCFLEYGLKIPVGPGDILIGQTHKEWHLNLTPVQGTKYSMVVYYRRNMANPKMAETTARIKAERQARRK
jgi:hypothetical protein